jgi:hypothetical protein
MSYEPRPGSLPQRVLAWLELQPHGAEFLTSQLGEALGVPPVNIPSCMGAALEAGLLYRRQKIAHQRAPAYWSLVDHAAGKPAARAANGAHADPVAGDEAAASPPPPPPPPPAASIPIIAFARQRAEHADARDRRTPTATPQPTGLRVALWSDGALVIERGPHLVASLTAEETRHLVEYLDKVLLDRVEPAC